MGDDDDEEEDGEERKAIFAEESEKKQKLEREREMNIWVIKRNGIFVVLCCVVLCSCEEKVDGGL